MQHLEVSGGVRPLKWPLGVKWLITIDSMWIDKEQHYCGKGWYWGIFNYRRKEDTGKAL